MVLFSIVFCPRKGDCPTPRYTQLIDLLLGMMTLLKNPLMEHKPDNVNLSCQCQLNDNKIKNFSPSCHLLPDEALLTMNVQVLPEGGQFGILIEHFDLIGGEAMSMGNSSFNQEHANSGNFRAATCFHGTFFNENNRNEAFYITEVKT